MASFLLMAAVLVTATPAPPASASAQFRLGRTATIPYSEAEPLFNLLTAYVPPELRDMQRPEVRAAWPAWIARRNAEIRGRVAGGDEDSLVNLWLFGTSFTAIPPVRDGPLSRSRSEARLAALLDAMAAPGSNTRLAAGRELFAARGVDVNSREGRHRAAQLLTDWRARLFAEAAQFERRLAGVSREDGFAQSRAYSTLYEHRGISTDTSLLSSYAIDAAVGALQASGAWRGRRVRRVALIGPGLDIINKADGHDFYPEQTIQPFAVIDMLFRHDLADPSNLDLVTIDVSERVNGHLTSARQRASDGEEYLLHVPLSGTDRWSPDVDAYWTRFGTAIGSEATPAPVPTSARSAIKVRAVRVRPEIVRAITPADLNVVVERLEQDDEHRFDLVIATNVFAYYGTFEQALATANIGRMLRPGGSLLANQAVLPVPPMAPEVGEYRVRYSDRQFDTVFWYRSQ